MLFDFEEQDLMRVGISILCGSIIGFERQYKNKAAGFRTLILICLGATVFTIASQRAGGESDDRIAANIITGIGFIGAGVIFKDGLTVKGLTTAAVIWMVAALGMVIGMFHFSLSLILTFVVLLVLSVFSYIEQLVDLIHHQRTFKITFADDRNSSLQSLQEMIKSRGLDPKIIQINKHHHKLHASLEISGPRKKIQQLGFEIIELPDIEDVLMS